MSTQTTTAAMTNADTHPVRMINRGKLLRGELCPERPIHSCRPPYAEMPTGTPVGRSVTLFPTLDAVWRCECGRFFVAHERGTWTRWTPAPWWQARKLRRRFGAKS